MSMPRATVDRLASLPPLSTIPHAQLEWLVAHGALRTFDAGATVYSQERPEGVLSPGHEIPGVFVVLSGNLSVRRVGQPGGGREIRRLAPGAVSGLLPYSRLTKPAGYIVAAETTEILLIASDDVREMTRECYEFTAYCVHEMLDRARVFKSDDLQLEKMTSLGRLSAGIAHELNNPSSAIARSAREMNACRLEIVAAAKALSMAGLHETQVAACRTLEAAAERPVDGSLSALARADREDVLDDWLDRHHIDTVTADRLATTGITVEDLDSVAGVLHAGQLGAALRCVVGSVTASRLTAEIDGAARRIHALVAAVKKHTHMDRAPEVEDIVLEPHLRDTLTLVKSRAADKAITLTLTVEPDLPTVRGLVGELNQVWLNLLDNAIDAVPEGGEIAMTAAGERNNVIVRVIDDGPGIPEGDLGRIFDPFFTTKPVGQGAGLGLDIVRTVIGSHQGSVDVFSRPGRTEFRVCLPGEVLRA